MDTIDLLIGKRITHKTFGVGTIARITQGTTGSMTLCALFETVGEKRFSYPECFEQYLELVDKEMIEAITKDRETVAKEMEAAKEQRIREARAEIALKEEERIRSRRRIPIRELKIFSSIEAFYDCFSEELGKEIEHIKSTGGKKQRLLEGRFIMRQGSAYFYSFEADSEQHFPDGTQITIWNPDGNIYATIVGCEDFTVTISCPVSLGDRVASIEISADAWKLLSSLIERLEELKANHTALVQALVTSGDEQVTPDKQLMTGQEHAYEMSMSQPITFIWGPPGTGKTETLAHIAVGHMNEGKRILMLSYSNVSVDGATMRVFGKDTSKTPGKIVRYGYPRDTELMAHPYLTSYNLAIHNHPELKNEQKELQAERVKTPKDSQRYVEITKRINKIRSQLTEEEKSAVHKARFVATTVSKAVIDKTIYEDDFDVVIFDEASMAYIPQIVFAAGLAKKHFVCLGDFAQLPPIVQSGRESALNTDIFCYCGIQAAVREGKGHNWLCMLDVQHRMHPQIAEFASEAMYQYRLRSADDMEEKRTSISLGAPFPGSAIAIADLSGMVNMCTKTGDESRINPLSALVSFSLALVAAGKHDVGIITPYNAQSRLLHAMARDALASMPEIHPIKCATVHQFQGSEQEVILYDAVDCFLQRFPGQLLTSTQNDSANRLFNVALTRARGKFVAVVNTDYMVKEKRLAPHLMFAKLLNRYMKAETLFNGDEINKSVGQLSGGCISWYGEDQAISGFVSDLNEAKKEIRIDIPGEIDELHFPEEIVCNALENAKRKGIKVVIRAAKKDSLPDRLKKLAIQYAQVYNAVTVIDKLVTWFGQPSSGAGFTGIATEYRPIIRMVGRFTATALYGFLEMSRDIDQSGQTNAPSEGYTLARYVMSTVKCPKCGKPMKLRKKSGFFLGCSGYPECSEVMTVDAKLVNDFLYHVGGTGLHCPQDHTSLEAHVGKSGVYIQCCGGTKHKYKLDEVF